MPPNNNPNNPPTPNDLANKQPATTTTLNGQPLQTPNQPTWNTDTGPHAIYHPGHATVRPETHQETDQTETVTAGPVQGWAAVPDVGVAAQWREDEWAGDEGRWWMWSRLRLWWQTLAGLGVFGRVVWGLWRGWLAVGDGAWRFVADWCRWPVRATLILSALWWLTPGPVRWLWTLGATVATIAGMCGGRATLRARSVSVMTVVKYRKRARTVRNRWTAAMKNGNLAEAANNGTKGELRVPVLKATRPHPHGVAVHVDPSNLGHDRHDFDRAANKIVNTFKARSMRCEDHNPGWGRTQTTRLIVRWQDPFPRTLRFTDLPPARRRLHVCTSLDEDWQGVEVDPFKPRLVVGAQGSGKALALDTPVPSPGGWTSMGDLRVGDRVFDESGRECSVVRAFPVLEGRPCFEVVFSDGSVIVADADHLWVTETRAEKVAAGRGRVPVPAGAVTTREIAATLRVRGAANHAIPVAGALQYPKRDLPLSPYALGCWLGGGESAGSTLTTADPEIVDHLRGEGLVVEKRSAPYRYSMAFPAPVRVECPCGGISLPGGNRCGACATRGSMRCVVCGAACRGVRCGKCRPAGWALTGVFRALGVLGDKHIPREYLEASVAQRRALLAGLLDTDGSATSAGGVEFYSANERLARGVLELATGLGYKATLRAKTARLNGKDCGLCWTVAFTAYDPVFRLTRKLVRQRLVGGAAQSRRRYIVEVRPVESVPVRCIMVDSPSHLYLVGEAGIPTHNSTDAWTLLLALKRAGFPVRLRVFDPKGGVELGLLEEVCWDYESNPARWPHFLGRACGALQVRQDVQKRASGGRVRALEMSADTPLDLMVIDELVTVMALSRGRMRAFGQDIAVKDAFAVYLSQQRASLSSTLALAQLSEKTVLGPARGLFTYVECLRINPTEPSIVDMLFGTGAHNVYRAHQLAPDASTAGIGWVDIPGRGVVRKRGAELLEEERTEVMHWLGASVHNQRKSGYRDPNAVIIQEDEGPPAAARRNSRAKKTPPAKTNPIAETGAGDDAS